MRYFAFFLQETGFVEKCLLLLKYIGNPYSKSVPHITLRLFDDNDTRIDYLRKTKITYLNIVAPGTFNFKSENKKKVVYLLCESEELEELDYRPDYPFSVLHITLYEGTDSEYASFLKNELDKIDWNIHLLFDYPIALEEKELGRSSDQKPDFTKLSQTIIGEDINKELRLDCASTKERMQMAKRVLDALKEYMNESNDKITRIKPEYSTTNSKDNGFIDEREKSSLKYEQLTMPGIDMYSLSPKKEDENLYVTPPEKARDMADCAIEAIQGITQIDFGDSSIGTGALYLAFIRRLAMNEAEGKYNKMDIKSAIGIDNDIRSAKEAYRRFRNRRLKIICGDAISDQINLLDKRNLMMVNPPYDRSDRILGDYRKRIHDIAKKETGIDVPANSGLYVYHMLIMDKWLNYSGIGVWLIPSSFLYTNYGVAVRKYLTTKVQLLRIHVYDEKEKQFDNAQVSSTIVVFKKIIPQENTMVMISYGRSLTDTKLKKQLRLSVLHNSLENWRKIIINDQSDKKTNNSKEIRFVDLFDVKRGVATGANKYFVVERARAKEIGIPDFAIKPILPKARFVKSTIVEKQADGFPDVMPQLVLIDCSLEEQEIKKKYPRFYDYLQKGREKDENGRCIIDRALVKTRSPWYKQETRDVPMFFMTNMGRGNKNSPPLYFLWNKSSAIALNTYLLVYPKKWLLDALSSDDNLCVQLLKCLNEENSKNLLINSRSLAGGLMKLEPGDMKEVRINKLPPAIWEAYQRSRSE